MRLSPDGRTVVVERRVNGNTDLWTIANGPQGALQRFTSHPAVEMSPVWSPDGTQIFQSSRKGGGFYDLYRKPVAGGDEVVLLESADNKTMNDWSLDNRFLLYVVQGREQVPRDLWAMPVNGDGKPFPVANGPFDDTNGRFSPDSRWVVPVERCRVQRRLCAAVSRARTRVADLDGAEAHRDGTAGGGNSITWAGTIG